MAGQDGAAELRDHQPGSVAADRVEVDGTGFGSAPRPEGFAAEWSPAELGQAIRATRRRLELSISEVARRSELAQSFLSQVELGRSDISVGRLVRVAQALGVRLTDLLDIPASSPGQVVRAAERIELPTPTDGLRIYLMAPSLDSGRTYATGTLDENAIVEPTLRSRGSESFVALVEGVVRIDLSTGAPVTLHPGDSVSYLSDDFVRMANVHSGRSVFFWVQAAPFTPTGRRHIKAL
jgi:transcriptional regulator with XRE-family HTH domain